MLLGLLGNGEPARLLISWRLSLLLWLLELLALLWVELWRLRLLVLGLIHRLLILRLIGGRLLRNKLLRLGLSLGLVHKLLALRFEIPTTIGRSAIAIRAVLVLGDDGAFLDARFIRCGHGSIRTLVQARAAGLVIELDAALGMQGIALVQVVIQGFSILFPGGQANPHRYGRAGLVIGLANILVVGHIDGGHSLSFGGVLHLWIFGDGADNIEFAKAIEFNRHGGFSFV